MKEEVGEVKEDGGMFQGYRRGPVGQDHDGEDGTADSDGRRRRLDHVGRVLEVAGKKPQHALGRRQHERAAPGFGVEDELIEGHPHVWPEGNLGAVEEVDLGGAVGAGRDDLVQVDAVLDHEVADLFLDLAGHGPDDNRRGADVDGLDGPQRRARGNDRRRNRGAGGPSTGPCPSKNREPPCSFHALPALRQPD